MKSKKANVEIKASNHNIYIKYNLYNVYYNLYSSICNKNYCGIQRSQKLPLPRLEQKMTSKQAYPNNLQEIRGLTFDIKKPD